MAEAAISVLLDQLASIARERVEEKLRLVMGVDADVKNLRRNLEAIQAVLKDAEKRQLKDDGVRLWLEELKDVSYDMDSVLDEWVTAILKSKFKDGLNNERAYTITKKKVFFSILLSCFCCGKLSDHDHRLGIAEKIQGLNERLDNIMIRKDRFNFKIASGDDIDELKRPNTTSFLDVPVVYGQHGYKSILIDRLMLCGSQEEKKIQVIPIVGMGGIGKTTLAKHVFNDDKVKEHFGGQRIWVCVSDPFNRDQIVKEITEQLTGQTSTIIGSEALMQRFHESIEGKKFLLVLDDMWTSKYKDWEPLEQALKCGDVESRVVVTTRKEEVAKMVGDKHMICMNKLSEEDCWLLLSAIAFFGKTDEEREDFEGISRKIASRCRGLPLAAKTLGSLLRIKRTAEWVHILKSDIWELENVKEDLFFPLLLSYYDLSPLEKRCFSYCAIFPKDSRIERGDLIQQWAAQGYFTLKNNEEAEQIGQMCFQNLATRSLFQDFEYDADWDRNIIACKMHDIVHDFVQFLTLNEYTTDFVWDSSKNLDFSARHLNIRIGQMVDFFVQISNAKNLHSLMVWYNGPIPRYIPDRFLDLRCLRTLRLSGWVPDLPSNIGELTHLRYLSLEDVAGVIKFPPTIGNLFNLQTLRLLRCQVIILPEEVGNLINLKHIYASYEDISWPKGVGRLRSLQTWKTIKISAKSENFQLRDLQNMNSLRDIHLEQLGMEEHVEEAIQAQIVRKVKLLNLSLMFVGDDPKIIDTHSKVLEALQPHENLKSLAISCFCGQSISPSWMISLVNLKRLLLRKCHMFELLPPLGKLPSLELLDVSEANGLKKIGLEFLGVEVDNSDGQGISSIPDSLFPKLKRISIEKAPSFADWASAPGWKVDGPLKIMPRLEFLLFDHCLRLKSLPDFLEAAPLKHLAILDSPALERSCKKETGTDWPKICHVPDIKISRTSGKRTTT